MAEAEIGVVGTKVKVVDEEGIILKLKRYEADALYDLLLNVGGRPRESRRGFTDSVCDALRGAGVRGICDRDFERPSSMSESQGIFFKDRDDIDYIINKSEEN